MTKPCEECDLLGYRTCDCLDEPRRLTDLRAEGRSAS